MKKIILLLGISLLLINVNLFAKGCQTGNNFIIGNTHIYRNYSSYNYNLDTVLNPQVSIPLSIRYIFYQSGENCWVNISEYAWYRNGELVSDSQTYIVTDAGFYEGIFTIYDYWDSSVVDTRHEYLNVGYIIPTSVNEINNNTNTTFSMYPSISTGVFSVKTKTPLTKIIITDATGKTVFTSTQNLPFIDISNLPEGIYFYYVEDRSSQVYRGRIVKN